MSRKLWHMWKIYCTSTCCYLSVLANYRICFFFVILKILESERPLNPCGPWGILIDQPCSKTYTDYKYYVVYFCWLLTKTFNLPCKLDSTAVSKWRQDKYFTVHRNSVCSRRRSLEPTAVLIACIQSVAQIHNIKGYFGKCTTFRITADWLRCRTCSL